MKSKFTEKNQKFNEKTLLLISSTHSGSIYSILGKKVKLIDSISIDLIPYPEKHGQLTKSGKNGNLQSSGMVYERDYKEEVSDYIQKITSLIQNYIKEHDNSVTRMIIAAPASIHSELSDTLLDNLHNIHLLEVSLVEGNYTNNSLEDIFNILNNKNMDDHVLVKNIK